MQCNAIQYITTNYVFLKIFDSKEKIFIGNNCYSLAAHYLFADRYLFLMKSTRCSKTRLG